MSEQKTFYKRLSEAKSEIGVISKDSTNPFFKSKYFDINALLAAVEPILYKHGLMVLQPISDGLVCSKLIDVESGEAMTSSMTLSDQKDPQKLGSEISYFRRYTLVSLLALQAEDDDANLASKQAKPAPKKAPVKKELPELTPDMPRFKGAAKAMANGEITLEGVKVAFRLSPENESKLLELAASLS